MFNEIRNIIDGVATSVMALLGSEDILFFAVLGVNLLLGIFLIIQAAVSFKKTVKKIHSAIASGEAYDGNPAVDLLRAGPGVLHIVAILFFVLASFLCGDLFMPLLGLFLFEIFNLIAKLIYNGQLKKAKKLYDAYYSEHAESGNESEEPYRPEPKAAPRTEDEKSESYGSKAEEEDEDEENEREVKQEPKVKPVIVPEPVVVEQVKIVEQPKPIEQPKPSESVAPTSARTVTPEPPKPTPAAQQPAAPVRPVTPPPAQPAPQAAPATGYQPFEPRRATGTPEYTIERAPTYSVPRPSAEEKPVTPTPAAPVTPKTTEPKDESSDAVDKVVSDINQYIKSGVTDKKMLSELIQTIQSERGKSKSPEQRARLSQALSDLLKAMNREG